MKRREFLDKIGAGLSIAPSLSKDLKQYIQQVLTKILLCISYPKKSHDESGVIGGKNESLLENKALEYLEKLKKADWVYTMGGKKGKDIIKRETELIHNQDESLKISIEKNTIKIGKYLFELDYIGRFSIDETKVKIRNMEYRESDQHWFIKLKVPIWPRPLSFSFSEKEMGEMRDQLFHGKSLIPVKNRENKTVFKLINNLKP